MPKITGRNIAKNDSSIRNTASRERETGPGEAMDPSQTQRKGASKRAARSKKANDSASPDQ